MQGFCPVFQLIVICRNAYAQGFARSYDCRLAKGHDSCYKYWNYHMPSSREYESSIENGRREKGEK